MCVNSVCLTSFNHSRLHVFSLGKMEERGEERLVMSQRPIPCAAASGNRKRKWPTRCRNQSLFLKKHLIGGWDRNPGANYFWPFQARRKARICDLRGSTQTNAPDICQSNKAAAGVRPVHLLLSQLMKVVERPGFQNTALIKTRSCFPLKEHTFLKE